jgi:hypothetical protein
MATVAWINTVDVHRTAGWLKLWVNAQTLTPINHIILIVMLQIRHAMVYQICIGLKIIHKSYHMVMDII